MDKPLVSIIIPTRNRAGLISETLDSLLAQSYQIWECIVVDDGSADNTKEVVQKYVDKDPRFILVDKPNTHKPGGNGARNYGFELAKGDYIQWFDSDDVMHPELLIDKIETFNKNKELKSVISQVAFFVGSLENITFITKLNHSHKLYEDVITYQTALYPGSIMLDARFLKNTQEIWDESLTRAQEFEFFSRLHIKNDIKTSIINKPYAFYRQHKGSISYKYKSGEYDRLISAYTAQYKIVTLLINQNKLSPLIVKHFLKHNKKTIAWLLTYSHNMLADNYAILNMHMLQEINKTYALTLLKIQYYFQKKLPLLNHIYLVDKETPVIRMIRANTNRIKKSIIQKGYLKEKLKFNS